MELKVWGDEANKMQRACMKTYSCFLHERNKHKLETENEKVRKRCQWLRPKVTGAGLVDEFGEECSSRKQWQRGAQHSPGLGTRQETEWSAGAGEQEGTGQLRRVANPRAKSLRFVFGAMGRLRGALGWRFRDLVNTLSPLTVKRRTEGVGGLEALRRLPRESREKSAMVPAGSRWGCGAGGWWTV